MKNAIAIHQPNYVPWLGYFHKIHMADYFVFLDDAQFSNTGLHNYHFLKTRKGPQRMRIPVIQTMGDKINEVKINNDLNWREKHLNLFRENYRNAEYFVEVFEDFSSLLNGDYDLLVDLNISIIKFICVKLGIESRFIKSSDLNISSGREEKIIEICKKLEGRVYLSGTGARAYQNEESFNKAGIQLKYLEYNILQYKQQYKDFQANVCVLDYLANCGYTWENILNKQEEF